MTHAEIRVTMYLADMARRVKRVDPNWAWENWTAFQTVMLRHARPTSAEFEVDDRQFTRCLRHAFVEVNYRP